MSNSNSSNSEKPAKPYPDFPLFAHNNGSWAKKIRGTFHYFGPWHDPDNALKKYLEQKDDLHAGRKPRPDTSAELVVKDLCNSFLNAKSEARDVGELSPLTWADYKRVCDMVVEQFGKNRVVSDIRPDDFAELRSKAARTWGVHRLTKMIQFTRSLFNYGYEAELLDKPPRFGPGFKLPSAATKRQHRAKQGPKLFSADEIRKMLDAATVPMRAMLLLGCNAAFGNSDCGQLVLSALDLEKGWLEFPRPKTGVQRRTPLWPETIEAIRAYLAKRPEPQHEEHKDVVFITKYGQPWFKDTFDNPITKETAKLIKTLDMPKKKGLGFYTLRHVFRTVADESKDQPAVDFIMGHESTHMSTHYRERISDERLQAVVDHVRDWLFSEEHC